LPLEINVANCFEHATDENGTAMQQQGFSVQKYLEPFWHRKDPIKFFPEEADAHIASSFSFFFLT